MKLLGRDIPAEALLERINAQLQQRGLEPVANGDRPDEGVEPAVDAWGFALHALEEHSNPTRALPLETHRGGLGRAVLVAKWAFRKSCQLFINEALGRQGVFNTHVRDSYAQLTAEVRRLQAEVERLKREAETSSKR